ncbi:MAG TPA: NUDIX domain-containing protein [Ideonella sp.]|uniref:NUDIX domain-containing protein n=1 Tax=Ideonella sp. TaxID=1929293 RepID=UPI002E337C29|nr:NUDIX domain-containing protein [Ideonella sp.]HEX5687391.1 NUDIX domain-containing protein [Ideonella sp.]
MSRSTSRAVWGDNGGSPERIVGKKSAGILPYRRVGNRVEVLLVHPGGPYWARWDDGAWSIGKGEYDADEAPFDAALREFQEETGHRPVGHFFRLTPIKQPGGKWISAWAVDDAWEPSGFRSNTFTLEWPRGSGKMRQFDEVDRVEWFDIQAAVVKIVPGQLGFLQELSEHLLGRGLRVHAARLARGPGPVRCGVPGSPGTCG